jgi:uncharacterized protein (TIGR02996 family)
MNDRESFLRAIEAEPDDDTVRLVFADWLDDNGDPDRARFIRLQCEYARAYGSCRPSKSAGPQRKLEQEMDGLLKLHRAQWTAGLPEWARNETFERGFPHLFSLTGKQFLDHAAAIRAVGPLDTLFLRLLKGRDVSVLSSAHLEGVRLLSVEGCQITDAGITAFTANPHARRVSRLWTERLGVLGEAKEANKLTDASAVALAETDNLPALTELDLSGYKKMSVEAIRALVGSEKREGLTILHLSGGTGGPSVATVFRTEDFRLTNLQELLLDDCRCGDDGATTLAASAGLRQLQVLSLTKNKITDKGALAIIRSPHLRSLRTLDLRENPRITDATAHAILADDRAWEEVGLLETGVSAELLERIAERCRQR